jgi:hypothetical protein
MVIIPNHELCSSSRGSVKLVAFAILYCGAAVEEKAIVVPAPTLGKIPTSALMS